MLSAPSSPTRPSPSPFPAQVKYRIVDGDIMIAGRYVVHKFMDPVKVEIRIRHGGELERRATSTMWCEIRIRS